MVSLIIKSAFFSLFGLFLALTPLLAYASIAINEVLFNPSGNNDRGLELIEIYNSGNSEEDLSGWQVYPDGIGYFLFPGGFKLDPKSFVTLHLRAIGANSQKDLYFSESIASNMGNTSGSAAIFSGAPRGKSTIKSFVQWGRAGETWESDAEEAGLWAKGTYIDIANLVEGNSIGLVQDGVGASASSWKIFNSPSIGLSNGQSGGVQSQVNVVNSPQNQSGAQSLQQQSAPYQQSNWPVIKVFAGVDKTVAVGSLTEFSGSALGFQNEPLENARFWWNFGDGASQEGKIISHIFQTPGNYTIGLHVSSGGFSASDYLSVSVVQNQIAISSVLVGKDGYIKINNPFGEEVDIGQWFFEDATGMIFVIPSKTKIGGKAEIAFSNALTGLLKDKFSLPVSMRYPGGSLALKWSGSVITNVSSAENGINVKDTSPLVNDSQPAESTAPDTVENDLIKKTAFAAGEKADRWLFLISALALGLLAALSYFFLKKSAK